MKFKAHAVVQGSPELKLRVRSEPIHFEVGAGGALKVALGPVCIDVEEVPISLTIPFLRRRGGVQAIGAIGPFGLRVKAVDAEARSVDVRLTGVLGKDGVACDLDGKVGCRTELDVVGSVPGKVARASVQLVDAEDDDEEEKS